MIGEKGAVGGTALLRALRDMDTRDVAVEALAKITREVGREIATAEEARRILGIRN